MKTSRDRVSHLWRRSFIFVVLAAAGSLFALPCFSQALKVATTVITGRIVGGDGKPLPKAFAALSRGHTWAKTEAVSEADPAGNFKITTEKRGLFYLVFSGLNHLGETTVLNLDRAKQIRIDVKLSVPKFQEDFSVSRIERNTFKKQPDGTYLLEVPFTGKEYPYQIGRVFKVRGSMVGTEPGEIRLHSSGLLMQKIAVPTEGKVAIRLEPAKLPAPSGPAEIRFADPRSADAKLNRLYREMASRTPQEFDVKPRATTAEEVERFLTRVNAEKDPFFQKLLWISYLDLTVFGNRPDPPMIEKALDAVSPTSPIWVFAPGLAEASVAAAKNPTKYSEYISTVAAVMPGDDRVGKPAPSFSAPSFTDPNVIYTNANLKAKLYLVDFWAAWCSPCIAQMPHLRRAYEKYRARGFEILSYSVDTDREAVIAFQKKHPMPWLNGIDPALGALNSEMAQQFRVAALPAAFLIDANGTIRATTLDLEGHDLDKAIEAALAKIEGANKDSSPAGAPLSFTTHKLASKLMARPMPYNVVLPSRYHEDSTARFPVIYLLHGLNGSYKTLSESDAMLRAFAKHQFIIVSVEGGNGFYTDSAGEPENKYESYIVKELVADVDERFRTIKQRSGRGIAGGSMGGYGALKLGMKYPDLFAVAGSFAGAVNAASWRTEEQLNAMPALVILPNVKGPLLTVYGRGATAAENDLFELINLMSQAQINGLPFFYMEVGLQDELKLAEPNRQLSLLMTKYGVAHEYKEFAGGHQLRPQSISDFLILAEGRLSAAMKSAAK